MFEELQKIRKALEAGVKEAVTANVTFSSLAVDIHAISESLKKIDGSAVVGTAVVPGTPTQHS